MKAKLRVAANAALAALASNKARKLETALVVIAVDAAARALGIKV